MLHWYLWQQGRLAAVVRNQGKKLHSLPCLYPNNIRRQRCKILAFGEYKASTVLRLHLPAASLKGLKAMPDLPQMISSKPAWASIGPLKHRHKNAVRERGPKTDIKPWIQVGGNEYLGLPLSLPLYSEVKTWILTSAAVGSAHIQCFGSGWLVKQQMCSLVCIGDIQLAHRFTVTSTSPSEEHDKATQPLGGPQPESCQTVPMLTVFNAVI